MQTLHAITQAAMQQDMARMERISTNLANALTPAFKREIATTLSATSSSDTSSPFAQVMQHVTRDLQPGSVKLTGHALDLALSGPGFLEVSTPDGPAYTRLGQLQLDAQGHLATMRGEPVMGTSGEITLNSGQVQIDALGVIMQDEHSVGQLKLVDFDDASALVARANGNFTATEQAGAHEATQAGVRQGYLENSNVAPMHEMVQMMQTVRHLESMQRVAQGMDDMLGVAIRKLGDL
jgi:flagellar basal-body rod protein FlgG